MALANNPIHAHSAETDSVIFIGVGMKASTAGVKTTAGARSATSDGIAKLEFSSRHSTSIRFASLATELRVSAWYLDESSLKLLESSLPSNAAGIVIVSVVMVLR